MLVVSATRAVMMAIAIASASGRAWAVEPDGDARALYAEGKAEYAQGHYAEAVLLFERSYALSGSPALLFNMAQAHRLAGPEHCSEALALYKSYLEALPDAENANEVAERIAELDDCAAQKLGSATPAPSAPRLVPVQVTNDSAPIPKRPGLPTGPVLTTGAGAALLVAGGVLYARAWDKHREAERICPCYPGSYAKWELLTNVSYALLAVGGATLAGGVTWWVVGAPSEDGRGSRTMLSVSGHF
jgi:tetratricopeptide (TPR) repeat protein